MEQKKMITAITSKALLQNWLGHRRLSRRVIEAFPEEELFKYSLGGMRPFGEMALEILNMGVPTLNGILTGEWEKMEDRSARPKKELLESWDTDIEQINTLFPRISADQFQQTMTAFGQWEMTVYELLFYVIDNEIHHRGQGYVYLRSLNIEPPFFPDRS